MLLSCVLARAMLPALRGRDGVVWVPLRTCDWCRCHPSVDAKSCVRQDVGSLCAPRRRRPSCASRGVGDVQHAEGYVCMFSYPTTLSLSLSLILSLVVARWRSPAVSFDVSPSLCFPFSRSLSVFFYLVISSLRLTPPPHPAPHHAHASFVKNVRTSDIITDPRYSSRSRSIRPD